MSTPPEPTFARLVDWVEKRLSPAEAQQVAEQVAVASAAVQAQVAWLRAIGQASQTVKLVKPPPAVRSAESGLTLLTSVLTILGMVIAMLLVDWRLRLAPLLSMPLIGLLYARLQGKVTASVRSQRKKAGKITAQLTENLAIMPAVQAFGRERYEVKCFNEANDQ